VSWCPRIGLGRIGGLCVLDNDSIRRDIDIAINKTIKELKTCDHLCCGNMGLVVFCNCRY
jgi:lantibiotic modifying enzyme